MDYPTQLFWTRFILQEFLPDLVRFPLWWYSKGIFRLLNFLQKELRDVLYLLSISLWIRNLFQPMYGDFSIAGRIISFVMRILVSSWKFLRFALWLLVFIVLFLAYLLLPPFTVYMLARSVVI